MPNLQVKGHMDMLIEKIKASLTNAFPHLKYHYHHRDEHGVSALKCDFIGWYYTSVVNSTIWIV